MQLMLMLIVFALPFLLLSFLSTQTAERSFGIPSGFTFRETAGKFSAQSVSLTQASL